MDPEFNQLPQMSTWLKAPSSPIWIMAPYPPKGSHCFCFCPTLVYSQQAARVNLIKPSEKISLYCTVDLKDGHNLKVESYILFGGNF